MTTPTLTLTLTTDEAQLVINALAELPVRVSLGLIQKIQRQADEQMAVPKEPAAT